jgi:hypothetical protein
MHASRSPQGIHFSINNGLHFESTSIQVRVIKAEEEINQRGEAK